MSGFVPTADVNTAAKTVLVHEDRPGARTGLPTQDRANRRMADTALIVRQQVNKARGVPAVAAARLDLSVELVDQSDDR